MQASPFGIACVHEGVRLEEGGLCLLEGREVDAGGEAFEAVDHIDQQVGPVLARQASPPGQVVLPADGRPDDPDLSTGHKLGSHGCPGEGTVAIGER